MKIVSDKKRSEGIYKTPENPGNRGVPELYNKELQEKLDEIVKDYNPETLADFKTMYTYPQLARKLGISRNNLHNWVRKAEQGNAKYDDFNEAIKKWDTIRCAAVADRLGDLSDTMQIFFMKVFLKLQEPIKYGIVNNNAEENKTQYKNLTEKEIREELQKEMKIAENQMGNKLVKMKPKKK